MVKKICKACLYTCLFLVFILTVAVFMSFAFAGDVRCLHDGEGQSAEATTIGKAVIQRDSPPGA